MSILRGDLTISADYDKLVLPSAAPVKDIERITREIMRGEYKVRPTTWLLGVDGNFVEGASLLQEKYGENARFQHLSLRANRESAATSTDYLSGSKKSQSQQSCGV